MQFNGEDCYNDYHILEYVPLSFSEDWTASQGEKLMDPAEDEVLCSASRQADRIVKLKIGKERKNERR